MNKISKKAFKPIDQKDYHQIQIKAIEEGIPYQTLISRGKATKQFR